MKNAMNRTLLMVVAMLFAATSAFAQIETPRPSPSAKFTQTVGLTDVTLDYSRPGIKGRTIFGDLVPYGKIWRTGANAATKISFSKDVTLEGNKVPAGDYALYTIPGETEWTVMIYKDLGLGGNVARYDEKNELVRFKVSTKELPWPMETFTIGVGNISDKSATIDILWEKTYAAVKMEVDTDTQVMASIEQFSKNPMGSVGGQFAQAANYYYLNDKDLNKALKWMTKAIEINPNAFWNIQRKAEIQAKMKDYKAAIATAKKSLEVAKAAQNDFGYIASNEKLIEAWKTKL
ncbi:DUF2911 domain-containing protein [Fulvivirgaceae bacterium BMA10]|uniref:DUF2911 domain-containing protein n=1 Tax=Splendidivirga corallicola TaxID=3051826 RepID=A0ABT8KSP1_9BACT|nr:DUF2911 domain-containing protein [Fulvivirgaceae bacterium BMA10]